MDIDEGFVFVVFGIAGLVTVERWYAPLVSIRRFTTASHNRLVLIVLPAFLAFMQIPFLFRFAAKEVRAVPAYMLLFAVAGMVWLGFSRAILAMSGISIRADVLEAGNPAATLVTCGMLVAQMLCYLGANIGEGPTIWTTFIPAMMATAALLMLSMFFEACTRNSDAITIDRDVSAAVRMAAMLISVALILGQAVAGDFVSWDATLQDFLVRGWFAIVPVIMAIVLHHFMRPTPQRFQPPVFSTGIVPGLAMLMLAAPWIVLAGAFH